MRTKRVLTVADKQADIAARIAAVNALGRIECPRCSAPLVNPNNFWPYFICKSCDHRWSRNPITDAMAHFLDQVHQRYPWDWFVTLTFARVVSPGGAQHIFQSYLDEIGREGVAKPYAFRADEYGPLFGRFHLHALIGNVRHLNFYCGNKLPPKTWGQRCCWLHRWYCGYARISPYDPAKGAGFYLSKYVTKAIAEYEFIGFDDGKLNFSVPPVGISD